MHPSTFYIMKTIIFDIDGTLTNMWPIEKSVLLSMTNGKYKNEIEKLKKSGISETYKIFLKVFENKVSKKRYIDFYNKSFSIILKNSNLPRPEKYPLVKWIFTNRNKYRFIYATGGQRLETLYVLKSFGLLKYFNLEYSIDKTTCRFSKKTGIPFRKIKSRFKNCVLISDSRSDCEGASLAQIPFVIVTPKQSCGLLSKISAL